jgi:hypothetical protein
MGSHPLNEPDATPQLLVYCIVSASAATPGDGRGVQGGELRRITHGELAAVVSPLTQPASVTTPASADLLDYERAIRAQHAVSDVVPMRFGSVLSNEAEVRAHLQAQRTAYLRALARTAGCVEMGVRALLSPPPPPAAPEATPRARSGAEYIKARQHRYSAENQSREHREAVEHLLLSKVSVLCREHRAEFSTPRAGEPALHSLYFLVPREQVAAFRAALSPLPTLDGATLALSGPWPPYNFVDDQSGLSIAL